jgi:mono/diheme cytochrome c family protein
MMLHQRLAMMMAIVAVTVAGLAAAADEGLQKNAALTTPQPDQVEKGLQLYAQYCIHCHGINMVTPGTAAFDLRTFPHNDKPRFVHSVINGKNNRMPAWGDVLQPSQIDDIWAYVLTGGKKK